MILFAVGPLVDLVPVLVDEGQIYFISVGRAVGAYPQRGGGVKEAEPFP